MSRFEMSLLRSAAVGAVVVFSCSLAVAAEQNANIEIAETTFASTGVSWQPAVSFESAILTVSGPGDLSLRREFAAGEALVFRVDDTNQAALEDGQYAWELRFSPVTDAVVKEALRAARASGDTSEIENLKKRGRLPAEALVISGYFSVQGGSIIVANEAEASTDAEASTRRGGGRVGATGSKQTADTDSGVPTKDYPILDDLIVDGSICAGFDCVNGESFGFDTIRIKENNLRIRAVDTSATASFPSRDWQITFNDSTNGGANKFSIDDIDGGRTPFTLEAGAPSHSLYVDDGGRVGFGTSTPSVELHLVDGDSPTLRLEQDGSSGFTSQTWDLAGNETNFFIRDVTNGSKLPFRIRPGAPTNAIHIAADGDVGFGTASPADGARLHVAANTGGAGAVDSIMLENVGPSRIRLKNTNITDSATLDQQWVLNGNGSFRISAGSDSPEFVLDAAGDLEIAGDLTVVGGCSGCDAVFQPGYDLGSIEEHARLMWENGFLPAVGPTAEGKTKISVFEKTTGMLNELEKAHVYIEQLHNRLQQQDRINEELMRRLEVLEKTAAR